MTVRYSAKPVFFQWTMRHRIAELKDTLFFNLARSVRNGDGAREFGWAKDGEKHIPRG